jgi:hypothetical protein
LKAELFSLNRLLSGERLAAKEHMTRALLEPAAFAGKPKKLPGTGSNKKKLWPPLQTIRLSPSAVREFKLFFV